jgi:DNA-binding GntR family transcriptional regulator
MHVVEVDIAFVASVNEVRLLLEPPAVGDATAHHTAETIGGLHDCLQESSHADEAGDLARLSLSNRQFHRALYAPHPNALLTSMLDGLHDKSALLSIVGWQGDLTWPTEQREHEEIVAAVEQREADRARALLHAHIKRFADRLLVRLGASTSDSEPEPADRQREHGVSR